MLTLGHNRGPISGNWKYLRRGGPQTFAEKRTSTGYDTGKEVETHGKIS